MHCQKCENRHGIKKTLEPGIGLLPCWGNYANNHSRGATLHAIGSVLGQVLKCGECGHSVSFNGELRMITGEYTPGYTYSI